MIHPCIPTSIYIDPISASQRIKVISKSLDPWPTWLVKGHLQVLSPVLCEIVNISLRDGYFILFHDTGLSHTHSQEAIPGPQNPTELPPSVQL